MSGPPSPDGALRLDNGVVELRIATAFGPRILHYGRVGGPNVFGWAPDATRATPHGTWHAYGGHRIWAAPEEFPETYTIDDAPPEIARDGPRRATVRRARDPRTGLRASIAVALAEASTEVEVEHVLANEGETARTVAPWGITVVAPGGTMLIPNAVFRPQREALLPARTMTLWHYTALHDPRVGFGPAFVRMRCDPSHPEPNKLGVAGDRGWFAYLAGETAFVVRTPYDAAATYPDGGASIEVYTEGGFCEVETLGPLVALGPGERVRHVVRWSLVAIDAETASDEAALASALESHLR